MSIVFTLVNADPFTSSGSDGLSESTVSVPPKARHYSDNDSPSHSSARFDDHSSRQSFNQIPTGSFHTERHDKKEEHRLWEKLSDHPSFSGSLNDLGNKLYPVANGRNMSGNNWQTGNSGNNSGSGNGVLTNNPTNGTKCVSTKKYVCPTISLVGGGNSSGSGSGSFNSGGGGSVILVGGGNSSGTGGGIGLGGGSDNLGIGGNFVQSPVPEAGEWAMISLGLFVMFVATRLRNRQIHVT
jgi:hypothetical protein